jgi:S-methylmethionine-dependent homocysteine/selenocysteine methylase
MGPLEDCYKPDLTPSDPELSVEHGLQARRLAACGVDLLLCETVGTMREAVALCRACVGTGVRTIISLLARPDGRLYNGEDIGMVARALGPMRPWAIGINCVSPRVLRASLDVLRAATPLPFGISGNVGEVGMEHSGELRCDISPEEYEDYAREWLSLGAAFIGGCCGTNPAYVSRIRKAVDLLALRGE